MEAAALPEPSDDQQQPLGRRRLPVLPMRHGTSAGSSHTTITNNRFARCTTQPHLLRGAGAAPCARASAAPQATATWSRSLTRTATSPKAARSVMFPTSFAARPHGRTTSGTTTARRHLLNEGGATRRHIGRRAADGGPCSGGVCPTECGAACRQRGRIVEESGPRVGRAGHASRYGRPVISRARDGHLVGD